jgi:hypothetical protein
MAGVTLLVKTDTTTFDFEHMMAHRLYFGAMSPLAHFSVLPYLLDPSFDTDHPASKWHLNHQQAHDDALVTLPARFGTTEDIGIFVGQIVREDDLSNQDQLTWWTFQNHQEHFVANDTLLPTTQLEYPFW